MIFNRWFIIFSFIGITQYSSSQSQTLIDLVNTDPCRTCRVSTNCQPNPLAGSIGYSDLGYTIEDIWGVKSIEIVQGRTFSFYNINPVQRQMIIEAIEILPQEYIAMLPANFRVGNPNRPYSMTSAGREIGGSKLCTPYSEDNLQYESIVLHEAIFTINNKKHRTVLHECGHFFSRKFHVVSRMDAVVRDSSDHYLTTDYHGLTSSHEETVAQCFMYFFHQMYFEHNNRLPVPKTFDQIVAQSARGFKPWMRNFIRTVIQETSSF